MVKRPFDDVHPSTLLQEALDTAILKTRHLHEFARAAEMQRLAITSKQFLQAYSDEVHLKLIREDIRRTG